MTYRPSDIELAQMAPADAYALGYNRGHDVARSRAESRIAIGLPLEQNQETCAQAFPDATSPIAEGE